MNTVKYIRRRLFFACIVLTIGMFSMGNYCLAQEQIVEEVEVTGKLFSEESHSRNMVIITATDLEEYKIKDMSQLFSFFTALNTSKRGAGETSFDITMRGSNFEQVLVTIDGVPLNNPQTGHFNSDFPFSIRDVERVEILRGGSSTTYGAGAFAGVVNIFLKKTPKTGNMQFSVSGGDKKYYSASLSAGKTFGDIGVRLSVDKSRSDGYYDAREFDNLKVTAGLFYSGEKTRIDMHAGFLDKDFGAAGFYAPYPSSETIRSNYYRLSATQRLKNVEISLTYSHNLHKDDFVLDRDRPQWFQSQSDTTVDYLNVSAAYIGERFSLTTGGEIKKETIASSTMGDHHRNRGALFANLNFPLLEKSGIDFGIRRNMEPGGNSNFTYYTGLYHHLGHGMVLRASYGKSFRLPSFTELYYQSPANIGNRDLKPEISHNLEGSFSWLNSGYQLDISVYYRNQHNILDWIQTVESTDSTSPWKAVNIEKNDIIGMELTQRFRLNATGTVISMGIEKLGAVNFKDTIISKYGLRFPDFTVKANILQSIGGTVKLAANYTYKEIYKTSEKGHFMNVVLTIPVKNLELGLRIDNLFNTIIQEIPGLNVSGRWAYVTLAVKL